VSRLEPDVLGGSLTLNDVLRQLDSARFARPRQHSEHNGQPNKPPADSENEHYDTRDDQGNP
jgi:hypothetical protein